MPCWRASRGRPGGSSRPRGRRGWRTSANWENVSPSRRPWRAAEKERLATQKALAAAEEEKKAKETVEDVLGFVEDNVFAAARPKDQEGGLGYDVKLADAIRAALPSIETRFRNKPLTEARLRRTIGTSFHFLGKPEITVGQFEAARSLYTRELGPDHPDTLWIMNRLSVAYSDLGQTAEALKLREETLALRKAKLGPDHPDTIASRGNLALSYLALGRTAEAVKLGEETLALEKAKLGPDHPETLTSMQILALGYASLGRHAEAIRLYEEALALAKTRLGPDHPETIRSMHNLSAQYAAVGRHAEALKLGEEALALRRRPSSAPTTPKRSIACAMWPPFSPPSAGTPTP